MTATAVEAPKTPARDASVAALVTGYAAQAAALRASLLAQVEALWRALGSYRTPQMNAFIKSLVPMLLGAEQQMTALTSGYVTQHQTLSLGKATQAVPIKPDLVTGPATRGGIDPTEVYERPFHQVWRDISTGKSPADAIDQGLTYATNLAATDLQRTKQLATKQAIAPARAVIGTRRVLEGTFSCGLCIVASTQLYRKSDLMPIHPGCDCGEDLVYRDEGTPTYGVINMPQLEDIHAAIEDTFGQSSPGARGIPGALVDGKPINYRDVLVTHEHGELGPILAVKGQRFTGPSDLS